jgi:hypothetical protein
MLFPFSKNTLICLHCSNTTLQAAKPHFNPAMQAQIGGDPQKNVCCTLYTSAQAI